MNKLIFVLMIITLAACEVVTPPECVQLCNRVEKWAESCAGPRLSRSTCEYTYRCEVGDDRCLQQQGVMCWNKLVEWTPNLKAEIDCALTPPRLSRL